MQSAREIWKALETRFSVPDDNRVCKLQGDLFEIVQDTKTVDEYYTSLMMIWEELKFYRPPPHCKCGKCNEGCFIVFQKQQEKDRVFKFLSGLNEGFAALRS